MPLLNSATGTLGIGDVHRYILRVDVSQLAADCVPLSIVVCNTSPFYRNLAVAQGPFALSATVEKRQGCGFATPYSSLSVTSLPTSRGSAEIGSEYSRDREELGGSLGLQSSLSGTHHSSGEDEGSANHSTTLSPGQYRGKRRRRRGLIRSSLAGTVSQSESDYTAGTSMFILCGQDWRSKFHLYRDRESEAIFELEIISEVNHLEHRVSYKVLVLAGKISSTVYPLGTSSSDIQRSHESFFAQPLSATSSLTTRVGSIWPRKTNQQATTDTRQWTIPQLIISPEVQVQCNPADTAQPVPLSTGDQQSSHSSSAGLRSSLVNKIRARRRFSDPECDPANSPSLISPLSKGNDCSQPTDQKLGDILTELHRTETTPKVFGDTCWTDHPTQWMDIGSLHLVVLSHGLMGSRLDELYIRESIQRAGMATESKSQHGKDGHSVLSSPSTHARDEPPVVHLGSSDGSDQQHRIIVLSSKANHGRTHEGIDINGQRLAEEILEAVQWQHNVRYYQRLARQIIRENPDYHLHAGRTGGDSSEQGTTASATPAASILYDEESGGTNGVYPETHATWQDKALRNRHRVSLVGHSLGGLINLNALHHLNRLTSGLFFIVFEPIHFITLATPFLGIGENFSVFGQACHWGAMGQTGKELAYLHKHHPKASLVNPNDPLALASASDSALLEPFRPHMTQSGTSGLVEPKDPIEPEHSQPLLSRLARWSIWSKSSTTSSSTESDPSSLQEPIRDDILLKMGRYHQPYLQLLRRFATRTAYANLDNDISVGFYTASLLYSNFDRDEFLKTVGQSTLKKLQRGSKLLWRRTLQSQRSLLHPIEEEREGLRRWKDNLSALSLSSSSHPPVLPTQPKSTEEGGSWSLWQDGYQYFRKFVSNPTNASSSVQGLQDSETTSANRLPASEPATESLVPTQSSTPIPLENSPPTTVLTTDTSTSINPTTRPTIPVIVHDETVADGQKGGVARLASLSNSRYHQVQPPWVTELAVGFHMEDLSWRKVHVYFATDAHNHIVSRRRYHQHTSQPVVDHLVRNHPFT